MSNIARVAGQAANTLSKPLDITDVFSTYLYEGNGSTQTITNGIDLDGEGGLVWLKGRNNGNSHYLHDSERTITKYLQSQTTAAEQNTGPVTSFNSNGFSLGFGQGNGGANSSGDTFASWTFRKAPRFFDVVTYTGTGSAGLTIDHSLGSVPGSIIVKRLNSTNAWTVYHRSLGNNKKLELNKTDSIVDIGNSIAWNTTTPTDTQFYLGADGGVNGNGGNYVAYLFAHNDGDGGFGDGSQDVIKCGSYTGNNGQSHHVELGFEPQWLLVKNADLGTGGAWWSVVDVMRGIANTSIKLLKANTSDAEINENAFTPTATGFTVSNNNDFQNNSTNTYIYMAIRRGPLAVPEDATEVFAIDTAGGTSPTPPTFTSGFPVDFSFYKNKTDGSNNWGSQNRLTGYGDLAFNTTSAEFSNNGSYWQKDYMNGIGSNTGTNSNGYQWMFKRAPGFFDAVAYTGNGTARNVSHNLGVAPEMMWVKSRTSSTASYQWWVYHKDLGNTKYLNLNQSYAENPNTDLWNSTTPTESVFTLGATAGVNWYSNDYIAYLFATAPGVSKVGSYTGNGSSQTIDCGFTSGARFVLIKCSSTTGNWVVYDTERGITGPGLADPALNLNNTNAEFSGADQLEPNSSGFVVKHDSGGFNVNQSSQTYIFYAIA